MCAFACARSVTWGWFSEPTTSSSMYKPSTNKDQKNTKAWAQCGPYFIYLFIFKDVSLCFSKTWLLLCSQTRMWKKKKKNLNPFGKLIRLCKLFRFLNSLFFNSLLKVQYFTHGLVFFSSSSPFPPLLMSLVETNFGHDESGWLELFGDGVSAAYIFQPWWGRWRESLTHFPFCCVLCCNRRSQTKI